MNLYDRVAFIVGCDRELVKRVLFAAGWAGDVPEQAAETPLQAAARQVARNFDVALARSMGWPLWADQFITDMPLHGYDTVLGWLAKNEPAMLRDMLASDVVEDTKRDGFWLCHRTRECGREVVKVPACPYLKERGVTQVNAYPVSLLERRFRG